MTEEEVTSMVKNLAQELKKKIIEETEEGKETSKQKPPVDPEKAIKEKSIICLECGKSFKILTKRHLNSHGLTSDQYREKWGYKKNQALIAKSLARERRKKMQEIELWKKRKPGQKKNNYSF